MVEIEKTVQIVEMVEIVECGNCEDFGVEISGCGNDYGLLWR